MCTVARALQIRRHSGDLDMASVYADCKADSCANSAVIGPAGQGVCLDHFFESCYQQLDKLEPMIRGRSLGATEVEAARAFLEECSNRTLVICFRNESLTNLERSRLLDILLWCRDLQLRLGR
jgi:hypothetical protein